MTNDAAASLRNAIAETGRPRPDDQTDFRIGAAVGAGYVGRDRSGALALLIPLIDAPAAPGRRGGGFSLRLISRVAFEFEGRRWEQPAAALECTDGALIEAFTVLALDAAQTFVSADQITWQALVEWLDEWQSLLAPRGVLTIEQQMGLWGELWIISNAHNVDSLVAGWRGPDQEATDFFLSGLGLEVKASRQPNVHHISQRQVDSPVGVHEMHVLSMWLGIDPVTGQSLPELVASVLAQVSDPPGFLKKIATVGYAPLDSDQYATKWIHLEQPRWFRGADIPRIRSADPGISQIRYVATLDIVRALPTDEAATLWRHFCGENVVVHR